MNVIFLGPPGSGKGTQAKRLAERMQLQHLSTGDLFREAITRQTALGREIKAYLDGGKLVPDELVSEVVFETLRGMTGQGVILDGYPRTVEQAKALDGFRERETFPIDAVVFFGVENAELVRRLTARRQCSVCKEVYNVLTKPPKVENRCDECDAPLSQRSDDTEAVVGERLIVYDRQTAPVLDHYRDRDGFVSLDAAKGIDDVFSDLTAGLGAAGARP